MQAFRASILDFIDNPVRSDHAWRYESDGLLIIDQGRIVYNEALSSSDNTLHVAYLAAPPADFAGQIPGVTAVRKKDDRHFSLTVDDRQAVTERLLAQSLESGFGLMELTTSGSELEQTFFDLTCKDEQTTVRVDQSMPAVSAADD